MKKNYNLEHILDSLYKNGYTNFINPFYYNELKNKISFKKFQIYKPYEDATKVIIYKDKFPDITLCKIEFSDNIRHQIVLKELFNLGLKEETFGDIIINDNIAYIYLLSSLYEYIKYNFEVYNLKIIKIEQEDIDYLSNYKNSYEEIELLVLSLRIDNIVSSITSDSRKSVLERFKNKDINLNYNVVTKNTIKLNENDVFSIRKYGKYKYNGIKRITKSGSFIISIYKYL